MKALHKNRLLKLADFLHNIPKNKFGFGSVVCGTETPRKTLDCGSTGCAIGWCPVVFPKLAKYVNVKGAFHLFSIHVKTANAHSNKGWDGWTSVGVDLFGITKAEAAALFTPGWEGDQHRRPLKLAGLYSNATPKQVAKNIRKFVAMCSK